MIEVSDWARDILGRSYEAARRFNPDARIRVARVRGSVQAVLSDEIRDGDQPVTVREGVTIHVEAGLEGLLDVEEPHDRLVLRPLGSAPNPRGAH